MQASLPVHVKRVHREIPAHRVLLPVAAKDHASLASERLNVFAQRGDFVGKSVTYDRYCAVVEAGSNRFQPCLPGTSHDVFWARGGGDIDVRNRMAKQSIAHRATNGAGLIAVLFDGRKDVLNARCVQPIRVTELIVDIDCHRTIRTHRAQRRRLCIASDGNPCPPARDSTWT